MKELVKSYGIKSIIATFCNALKIDTGIKCDCIEELKLKKVELSHEVGIPKSFVLRSFHTHELSRKASLHELASNFAWHPEHTPINLFSFKLKDRMKVGLRI